MPDPQQSSPALPIALLYQAGDLGGHLKTALHELGAAIVYESQASRLDRVALEGSGARIVVFNLDPESEAEIDQVCDVLDSGDYEVVFNDADVSAQLSGWDQARWARNLAAKILHRPEIATPPRPAWAESVPTPAQMTAARAEAKSAPAEPAARRSEPAPAAAPVVPPAAVAAPAPAPVAPKSEPAAPAFEPRRPVEPSPSSQAPTLELPILEGFDLGDLQIDMGIEAPAEPEKNTDFAAALDEFAAAVPAAEQHAPSPNADEFASELDSLFASASGSARAGASGDTPDAGDMSIDFPSMFDQGHAAAVPEAVERTYKPAPLRGREPAAAEPAAAAAPVAAAEPLLPPDWTLEPLDEEGTSAKPLEKSSAFGIETMTTSEFLGSADDAAVAPVMPAGDAFAFELMPMEDAVAPQAYVETPDEPAAPASVPASKFQLGAATQVRRVFVLGASIGGPEAVREFLGALPAQFPALFVLAQHMGDEFLELMSMQLAKAVKLTVRTPTHGEHVGHGEVVIVPTRERMRIDSEGVIALSPLIERTPYSPSIDQVMRDVADEFGSRAGAIVFSGMAQDAIDGSKYVVARGGTVWAQDPDSCTISTMVDSVRQTGTVSFVGSPPQLAAKLVAEFGA